MAKNSGGGVSLVVVAILALVIGWFGHQYFGDTVTHIIGQIQSAHESKPAEGTAGKPGNETLCAQVVTSARNPSTGDIKVFPTPCDVPKGWEVIQNDTPGL